MLTFPSELRASTSATRCRTAAHSPQSRYSSWRPCLADLAREGNLDGRHDAPRLRPQGAQAVIPGVWWTPSEASHWHRRRTMARRRTFSRKFEIEALKLVKHRDVSVAQAARERTLDDDLMKLHGSDTVAATRGARRVLSAPTSSPCRFQVSATDLYIPDLSFMSVVRPALFRLSERL